MDLLKTTNYEIAVYLKGERQMSKLAILLPGRLDTKDYPHMRSHTEFLFTLGFLALAIDPPGTWGSPGGIELYTTSKILAVVDEIIAYYGSPPTLLLGHSRGGTHALLAGMRNPAITHMVAVMSHGGPSTTFTPISLRDAPSMPGETGAGFREFRLPTTYQDDEAKYNTNPGLRSCCKPKLFISGTRDVLVPAPSVNEMYNAAAPPKMIHSVDSDHDYRRHPAIIEEVNQVVAEFLGRFPI